MAHITFKGKDHQARFLAAVQTYEHVFDGTIDPEYGAALFVLTSDARTWQQAQGYVKRNGIRFAELLEECDWSGGYGVLIRWAANLFNEKAIPALGPVELMRLDEGNFAVAVSALHIRRSGLSIGAARCSVEVSAGGNDASPHRMALEIASGVALQLGGDQPELFSAFLSSIIGQVTDPHMQRLLRSCEARGLEMMTRKEGTS
jgi:hypothetical protein